MSKDYTADQLELLYWNTWAFRRTAETIQAEGKKMEPPLGSPGEISLSTVATVNLGLSLELLLKYSIAMSGHRFPYTHSLVEIYEAMPEELRLKMSASYDAYSDNNIKEDIFKATLRSPSEPSDPPAFDTITLEAFLSYLDKIGTYDKRYKFEDFSQSEWWIRVDVDWLAGLIRELSKVASSLRENAKKL